VSLKLKFSFKKLLMIGLGLFVVIGVVSFAAIKIIQKYEFRDETPDRGALGISGDEFGEDYATPTYLDQGWTPKDSLWFYSVTQGSNLMPYDFFLALEQKDSPELFRSPKNINHYRYLPQKATSSNPDALPVGMVGDTYQGKHYLGFTCAACHTGQVYYQGKAIRIDGGQTMADMDGFMVDLGKALAATDADEIKREAFVKRVLALKTDKTRTQTGAGYKAEEEVLADLKLYIARLARYNTINHSHLDYGHGRLDAFGRIYNRVLEHIITKEQLETVLKEILPADEAAELVAGIHQDIVRDGDFDHLVEKLERRVSLRQLIKIRNKLFNEPDAPVSYPFLWDIAQHDYVQWNGIAGNAGVGPIGRNAGEVVGVFATLDWQRKPGFSLSSQIGRQGLFSDSHISYQSSINLGNLRRIEMKLAELQSPQWPTDILPAIDLKRAAAGRKHFVQYCSSCHFDIDRSDKNRKVVAQMIKLSVIQTDPKMSENSTNYVGYSGIIENQYLKLDAGQILIEPKAPVAALLTAATTNVVATPKLVADPNKPVNRDPTQNFFYGWAEWLYELVFAYFKSDIQPTIKRGNYTPDTSAAPLASLGAYKARPLNGIWATAPYLHNGSVPSLYELLLPKKRPTDSKTGKYRTDEFWVGKREIDPVNVGIVSTQGQGSRFLTFLKGNSNAGHEYGMGRAPETADGKILKPLTDEQRWELVEYMKTL